MRMLCSVLALLLTLSAHAFSQQNPDPATPRTHALKITRDGLLLVTATAADTIGGNFIFDTGAGVHVLSNRLFKKLRSTPAGHFTGFRHTGERVDFELFQIEAFSMAGLREKHPLVAVWSALDSFQIDGILSMKFFEHQPVTIDLRDSVLVVETARSLERRMSVGTPLPLRVDDDRGIALDIFGNAQVGDSLKLECIIDTGSPSTILDARYMQALGIDSASEKVTRRVRKSNFGASETEYVAPIPFIALWGDPASAITNRRVVFKRNLIYDGLLGTSFLLGRSLTIDIQGRRFLLTP